MKENKRLVLVKGENLSTSTVKDIGGAKAFAFEIISDNREDGVHISLAAESAGELEMWKSKLSKAMRQDMLLTFQLGSQMAQKLQAFKMSVKNRRAKIEDRDKDRFRPQFKTKLWKLKGEGNTMKPADWFERDMWLARNGSFVYWSRKEERELIYFTAADLVRSKVVAIKDGKCCLKHAFEIQLPPANGVEFAPSEFAANSEEEKQSWMAELKKYMR